MSITDRRQRVDAEEKGLPKATATGRSQAAFQGVGSTKQIPRSKDRVGSEIRHDREQEKAWPGHRQK
jgi:hypothetical protein